MDLTWIYGVLIISIQLFECSTTGFTEVPMDVTLPLGSLAEFRCQHPTADDITWAINGTSLNQLQDPDIVTSSRIENGSAVQILSIPALLMYNNTDVVCIAVILNPLTSESSPSASLTVLPEMIEITTPSPQIMTTDFIEVPSPPVVVVPLDGLHNTYQYRCRHSETDRIFWIINGTRLVDLRPPPPSISDPTILLPSGDLVYTLTIGGLLQHNGTTIQCLAESQDQSSTSRTPNAVFLIQGPPQSVSDLRRYANTIIWEAPFSLNLTNIEPDIVYCVEVYNITCGRSHVISDCDVTESRYTNNDLQSGYIYEYTITPRSNVQGALNGTDLEVSEGFMKLLLGRSFKISITDDSSSIVSASAYLNIITPDTQGLVFAARHFLSLTPLDFVEENGSSLLVPTDTTRNGNSVKIETSLPFRRRFNCIVLAHGCDQHPVTETTEISTHDIQNILVTSTQPGSIRITGDFIRDSSAIGVLVIIIHLNTEANVIYSFRPRESTTALRDEDVSVLGGHYSVSLFVVEEVGDVFSRTASSPISLSVDNGIGSTQSPISYSVQSNVNSTGVCITCTFLESSTTDCVAVVHQRISQLNSSGLMNIESSHKFTRFGDTASGCIEGVNLEDYQVGVIGVNTEVVITDPPTEGGHDHESSSTCVWCIIIALAILLMVSITVGLIVILCIRYAMKRIETVSDENDIELEKCGAYEVVQLSRQRVTMNENPAYGEVGTAVQ